MEKATYEVLNFLLVKRYIGNKHFPENKIIISKIRFADKKERHLFDNEYRELINKKCLLKMKKRTGKGTEWHISINPRKINEIIDMLNKGE